MTKAPMAKDRHKPKQAAILCAAADLFVQHGYDGTSTEMIAEAAGVSRQTIYNQFENKEALFRAIATELVAEIVVSLGEAVKSGADVRETLLALAQRLLKMLVHPKVVALHRLMLTEMPRFPELGRAIYDSGPATTEAELAAYLHEQARLGRLQIDEPRLAAQQFFALTVHHLKFKTMMGLAADIGEDEITAQSEAAVATFLRAFGPPK